MRDRYVVSKHCRLENSRDVPRGINNSPADLVSEVEENGKEEGEERTRLVLVRQSVSSKGGNILEQADQRSVDRDEVEEDKGLERSRVIHLRRHA